MTYFIKKIKHLYGFDGQREGVQLYFDNENGLF